MERTQVWNQAELVHLQLRLHVSHSIYLGFSFLICAMTLMIIYQYQLGYSLTLVVETSKQNARQRDVMHLINSLSQKLMLPLSCCSSSLNGGRKKGRKDERKGGREGKSTPSFEQPAWKLHRPLLFTPTGENLVMQSLVISLAAREIEHQQLSFVVFGLLCSLYAHLKLGMAPLLRKKGEWMLQDAQESVTPCRVVVWRIQ